MWLLRRLENDYYMSWLNVDNVQETSALECIYYEKIHWKGVGDNVGGWSPTFTHFQFEHLLEFDELKDYRK